MKENAYWNMDSFGTTCPTNWEDIAAAANALIDAGEDSEELWEEFSGEGKIDGVWAVYALEDINPVDIIATVTGTRRSAETAVRNGADRDLMTPEGFIEAIRSAADEDDNIDYDAALEQAKAGELRWDGIHNGIYHGTPFVWFHG